MHTALTLGISPCPNDTFIFDAWINGRMGPDTPPVRAHLADIEALNCSALQGDFDVVKVSFFAWFRLGSQYRLLQTGGALGRGCGPLVVSRIPEMNRQDLARSGLRIAVPGELTTANLLLRLYQPAAASPLIMPFDRIMPAVAQGETDAGVIIHEGRFTCRDHGLHILADLGEWWEETSGLPIPLGCIVARNTLEPDTIACLERTIRASLRHAREHPWDSHDFIRFHAQDMDPRVIAQHIELYVNRFTEDYGDEGRAAIGCLMERASEANLL